MIPEYELKAQDIHHVALQNAKKHFSLTSNGYQCDTDMIFNILFKAATDCVSIETACNDLLNTASSNRVREHLNEQLDVCYLREQECEMNRALAEKIPDEIFEQKLEVAFDFHDEPFYGKTPELRTYTCRGKAKKGTTHFFRIASAYVIWRDIRLTLAVTYVLPEDTTLEVLKRLLFRLKHLKLRLDVAYLDKGFCSTAIIRYLTAQNQPAILACAIRGKKGGTRTLQRTQKLSYFIYLYRWHESYSRSQDYTRSWEGRQAATKMVSLRGYSPRLDTEKSLQTLSPSFWYRMLLSHVAVGASFHSVQEPGFAFLSFGTWLVVNQHLGSITMAFFSPAGTRP